MKPRYTVDVAVIGFSEGTADTKGRVRSLLIAMMDEEGKYQIVGRTGNGMSDEFRAVTALGLRRSLWVVFLGFGWFVA